MSTHRSLPVPMIRKKHQSPLFKWFGAFFIQAENRAWTHAPFYKWKCLHPEYLYFMALLTHIKPSCHNSYHNYKVIFIPSCSSSHFLYFALSIYMYCQTLSPETPFRHTMSKPCLFLSANTPLSLLASYMFPFPSHYNTPHLTCCQVYKHATHLPSEKSHAPWL